MRSGIQLGRVFGVRIFIDWSWLLIFVLITWNLAVAVMPSLHPNWSPGLTVSMAVIASLLFFASVLAHELAHSLVALARGLPVRRITLFIFGGVSNIEREPESPLTEFLVALVGPVVSIVLGVAFTLAGLLLSGRFLAAPGEVEQFLAQAGPLATIFLWLGPINIVLAVFNLIPGFPLDGGRVLRSLLWAIFGNLRQATRLATWIGQGLAWLFIIGGIAMVFGVNLPWLGSGLISGLWLAFIGWFLNNAAVQSYQQVVVRDILEGVPVGRLMRPNAPTVPSDISLTHLVDDYLMTSDERSYAVLEDGRLAGMISLDDVRQVPRDAWDTTRVSQAMTPASDISTATPREEVSDALERLAGRDVRQMPVLDGGRLVGMLRRRDILRWLQLQSQFAPR